MDILTKKTLDEIKGEEDKDRIALNATRESLAYNLLHGMGNQMKEDLNHPLTMDDNKILKSFKKQEKRHRIKEFLFGKYNV